MWTEEFARLLEESTVGKPLVGDALALKDRHLPGRVYKYRCDTPYSRENLSSDTVWMASPESYNDPYDSWLTFPRDTLLQLLEARLVDPFVDATKLRGAVSPTDIENARASAVPLATVLEQVRAVKGAATFGYWSDKTKSYLSELHQYAQATVSRIEQFRRREKVCSFSAVSDSILMWSHYADHHKGLCIEYEIERLDADHRFRKNLYPVLYSRKFYNLDRFMTDLTSGSGDQLRSMIPLLAMLHKFDGWRYEEEWRLIRETEAIEADHNWDAPIPSRVILGAKFEPSVGRDLLQICRQKAVPLFQMHLAPDKFELLEQRFAG